MHYLLTHDSPPVPGNKGKITGQKPPLKRNEIGAIRVRLQIRRGIRDLALFNLAIDSKPRLRPGQSPGPGPAGHAWQPDGDSSDHHAAEDQTASSV